jgi:hypothetical protein
VSLTVHRSPPPPGLDAPIIEVDPNADPNADVRAMVATIAGQLAQPIPIGPIPAPPLVKFGLGHLSHRAADDPPWKLTTPDGVAHPFESFTDALAGHHLLCPDDPLVLGPLTLAALRAELAR